MNFIDFLKNTSASWVLAIIIALYLIIEFYHRWEDIKSIITKISGFFKKVFGFASRVKRSNYDRCVSEKPFIIWEKQVLYKIYAPILDEYNKKHHPGSNRFAEKPFDDTSATEDSCAYPALCFCMPRGVLCTYPFKGMLNKEEVEYNNFINGKGKIIHRKYSGEQRKYFSMLKSTIRFPDNIGYMLNTIDPDNSRDNGYFHITAKTALYIDNVCTSHYLEYELYKLYKRKYRKEYKKAYGKNGSRDRQIKETAEQLLGMLPERKRIHDECDKPEDIFTSGKGRCSLLSVSMMVACKNHSGTYDIIRVRRSGNVDAKVGFIQFIPSGGFSALSSDVDFDTQFSNASITKGLFRELLEECFGEEDFSGRANISSEAVYTHPIMEKILRDIEDTDNETEIYFLGTALGLDNLRHELCFFMVVDDAEICGLIKNNEECRNVIQFVPIDKMNSKGFWTGYAESNAEDSDGITDYEILNDTSAALWNLVRESPVYKNMVSCQLRGKNIK